jgi:hypothetical protein
MIQKDQQQTAYEILWSKRIIIIQKKKKKKIPIAIRCGTDNSLAN